MLCMIGEKATGRVTKDVMTEIKPKNCANQNVMLAKNVGLFV